MTMIRTVVAAVLFMMIAANPAHAAQSYIYVAVAAPPCAANGCPPGQLLVFDAITRQLVTSVELGNATNRPAGMAMSPDGRRLYVSMVASDGGASLVTFDAARHVTGPVFPVTPAAAGAVAVTRDNKRVFIGGSRLLVWDTESTTVTAVQEESYRELLSHPALDRVIGGVSTFFLLRTISVLDETTGAILASKNVGSGARLTMAADGSRVYDTLTATFTKPSNGGYVYIFDAISLETQGTLRPCPPVCFPSLTVDAPARDRLYVMADSGIFAALDRTTGTSVESLNTVPYRLTTAVVSADERRAWVASARVPTAPGFPDDGSDTLTVVDLESFALAGAIPLATSPLFLAATPPNAARCAYTVNTTQSSWTQAGGTATITLSTECAWQASTNASWLHLPAGAATGLGARTLNVTVDPYFGGDAARSATLTIGGQVVTFTQAGFGSQAAFGIVDTPADNVSGVTGSLSVSGWALDDVGVTRVRITRDAVWGEFPGQVHVGAATFVDGARPDVQAAYPSLPFASRAGWGYLLLTNMLPGGGTGTYRLHAYADDIDGHTTLLGSRTFTTANSTATLPFGTIDTPGQGEIVSGTITNWGWVLTPQPANIPVDGSTIEVLIDNVVVGRPVFGFNRPDIAALFPGYANTNSAVGYFTFDTTTLANGLHSIAGSCATTSAGSRASAAAT